MVCKGFHSDYQIALLDRFIIVSHDCHGISNHRPLDCFLCLFFFKFFFQHVVQANIEVSNHLPFLRGIYHWEVHSPYKRPVMPKAFQALNWRHNDHDGVSNHQPHGYLLNRLFRRRSKETSKLRVTGLCLGNSPGWIPRTKGQCVSIWWRHHDILVTRPLTMA